MTIKELETRTGMTRANIRFYEGEGLLTPKRLDNGYRDYSEEDARTLEKVRLLRQLQLDIDTIRKIQAGALTLEQALFVQSTKLEGDRAVIERAAEVCRGIEASGVEYAALEPRPWLIRLQPPERPSLPVPPPPAPAAAEGGREEEPSACWHPWMRLFARELDMVLYGTIYEVLWMLLFWDQDVPLSTWGFLQSLALLAFALAVEPLWLHFLGWTPGKWLFGLKVRDVDGGKLTIEKGLARSWQVFREGYGWYIPFWSEWRMWQCRKLGLEGQDCWWDTDWCLHYTKVERRVHSGAVFVLALLVCAGTAQAAKELTDLPRYRGGLTVEEFSRNYNQFRDRLEFDDVPALDMEGQWDEWEQDGTVVVHGATSYISSDGTTYTIENPVEGTTVWPPLEFAMEDGRITAVTVRAESRDSMINTLWMREYLLLAAMSGSADGQDILRFDVADGLPTMLNMAPSEDAELDFWGLHLSQRVDCEGYDPDTMWALDEDAPRRFEKTLTISLPEAQ